MTDRNNTDDDRFDEPPTTFFGILEKSLEGLENALDEVREGIEEADEDHPLDPADPLKRIRERLEDADDAVTIDVEEELRTLRENAGLSDESVQRFEREFDMSTKPPYGTSDDDPDPYAEIRGAPLLSVIGDGPRQRILATFIGKHYTPLGSDDVAQLTGVEREVAYDHLHALEDRGVLEAERVDGGGTEWSLNTSHPIARKLGQLDHVSSQAWWDDDGE